VVAGKNVEGGGYSQLQGTILLSLPVQTAQYQEEGV